MEKRGSFWCLREISIGQLAIMANVHYQTAYRWVVSGQVRSIRRCDYPGKGPKHYVIPFTARVWRFGMARLGGYRTTRAYWQACMKAGF